MKHTNDTIGHSGVHKCRNGHVFMYAGALPIPQGWKCECGGITYGPYGVSDSSPRRSKPHVANSGIRGEIQQALREYRITSDMAWSEVKDEFYTQKEYEAARERIENKATDALVELLVSELEGLKAKAEKINRSGVIWEMVDVEAIDERIAELSRG